MFKANFWQDAASRVIFIPAIRTSFFIGHPHAA
jgi:hypothetical protein